MDPTQHSVRIASQIGRNIKSKLDDETPKQNGKEDDSRKGSSQYQRSPDGDAIGKTFPGHEELENVPYLEDDTSPEAALINKFNPIEELKTMLPNQFKEVEHKDWRSRIWLFGLGLNARTLFISALSVPIAYSALSGSPRPLQFPVQLVLLRLYMLIQDYMLTHCGKRLRSHSLVRKLFNIC